MAIDVKDAATAASKFTARGAAAAGDYAAGVRGSGAKWERATAMAEDNYNAGIQEAIGRKAFLKGIAAAGGGKYETKAASTGARRYPEGIREAGGSYQEKVQPYLATIASLSLPPRRPKGDPANFARVQAVGEALRRKKVGG
jgi:hypothetical protein